MRRWWQYAPVLAVALLGWWALAACQAAPRPTGADVPDGDQQIALTLGRDAYLYDASTETLIQLTRGGNVEWVVWSPDGEKLAVETDDNSGPDLYVLDIATGQITRLFNSTRVTPFHQHYSDRYIHWSPDSRLLVYEVATGGGADLYLIEVETGELTNLTGGQYPYSWQYVVDWSPDGRQILFDIGDSADPSGQPEIHAIAMDTQQIQTLGNGRQPAWSPDGERIAYLQPVSGADARSEVYVMQADGSDPQRVVDRAGDYGGPPIWSPDGQYVAFLENIRDDEDHVVSHNVYLTDFDSVWFDGEMTTQRSAFRDPFPQWTPGSNSLVFGTDSALCWHDPQGGEPVCQFDDVTSDPLLAPDGKQVVYLSYSEASKRFAVCVGSIDGDRQCGDDLDEYSWLVVMVGWRP